MGIISEEVIMQFILESLFIENEIVNTPYDIIFVNHYNAIKYILLDNSFKKTGVINKYVLSKNVIPKGIIPYRSKYRQCNMMVGDYICPNPKKVPVMMDEWYSELNSEFTKISCGSDEKAKEKFCWKYHHWFLCIHPFVDGNGRTARLIYNNLRFMLGLRWEIIYFSKKKSIMIL